MIWLSLDPAAKCGWCWSNGAELRFGVWNLTAPGDTHCGRRLSRFADVLRVTHSANRFDRIAYEDAAFGSHNPAVKALHSELAAVVKIVSEELGLPDPLPVNPATLKKWATGNGRAKKWQMIAALERLYGIKTNDDNCADAILICKYAEFSDGSPLVAAARKAKKPKSAAKHAPMLFR
jgi:Holliday junction resolvasome RuvABC endonuclease subunit